MMATTLSLRVETLSSSGDSVGLKPRSGFPDRSMPPRQELLINRVAKEIIERWMIGRLDGAVRQRRE